MAVVGSPVVGELPKTGIFREAEVRQSMTLNEFLQDADEWHQERFVVVCLSSFTFPWISCFYSRGVGKGGADLSKRGISDAGIRGSTILRSI